MARGTSCLSRLCRSCTYAVRSSCFPTVKGPIAFAPRWYTTSSASLQVVPRRLCGRAVFLRKEARDTSRPVASLCVLALGLLSLTWSTTLLLYGLARRCTMTLVRCCSNCTSSTHAACSFGVMRFAAALTFDWLCRDCIVCSPRTFTASGGGLAGRGS
jgi:hypothetical protein